MTARDFLWCTLNLMLDDEEELAALCPACRERAVEERCAACGMPLAATEGYTNANFDEAHFLALKRGDAVD